MPQASQEKLARDRASYAERRLRELRTICPELPGDILERTSLRSLTFAVRRASRRAGPYQTTLRTQRGLLPLEDLSTGKPKAATAAAQAGVAQTAAAQQDTGAFIQGESRSCAYSKDLE